MQEGSNPENNPSLRETNALNISKLVDHLNSTAHFFQHCNFNSNKNVCEIPPGTRVKLTPGVVVLSMKFSMGFLNLF
jgi:hypothetical protein